MTSSAQKLAFWEEGEMKKKGIKIEWESMTGFGPAAWDNDHSVLAIHTPHHENDHPSEPVGGDKKGMQEVHQPLPNAKT